MRVRVDQTTPDNEEIRVLVVDGNTREAAAMRHSLNGASANFVVSPARQLWSATQILAGMSIDVVVLGQQLPDSDGLSALAELREQAPDTPVVFVGSDDELGDRAVAAGADEYLNGEQLDARLVSRRVLQAMERRQATSSNSDAAHRRPRAPTEGSILVVEQDPWVQRLLTRNLTRQGHRVEAVMSPPRALAWSQAGNPELDLLICDAHLPGMNGQRLSAHLRKSFPQLVTLLVSEASEPVEAGSEIAARLTKPYSLDEFQAAVARLIGPAVQPDQ